jgi:hypothetical protein
MARRSYTRDARGRFASTPGGGARKAVKLPAPARRTAGSKPQKRRGLLIQRSAAAASKRKLKGLDPADQSLSGSLKRRAQKGAVTRTANRLKAAQQSGRVRMKAAGGVVRTGRNRPSVRPGVNRATTDNLLSMSYKQLKAEYRKAGMAHNQNVQAYIDGKIGADELRASRDRKKAILAAAEVNKEEKRLFRG